MSQTIVGVLQKSQDLVLINQTPAALDLLVDFLQNKRVRYLPNVIDVILKALDLSVLLKRSKVSKDIIYTAKNIFLNANVPSVGDLEHTLKYFISLAHQHLGTQVSDDIDDLDFAISPEEIALAALNLTTHKEKQYDGKFYLVLLWEAYRTALDITRNNSKLELIYDEFAQKAFDFCKEYNRKIEFRRLADLLRQHLSSVGKNFNQLNPISLDDPETLQRHLDIRFYQLSSASDMELWQEAFKTIEDIQYLMSISKKAPKMAVMASYYEKLSTIFLVGENFLFHSASLSLFYSMACRLNKMNEEEQTRISSSVLLSALSIPIHFVDKLNADSEETIQKNFRLSSLLHTKQPTRDTLLKQALLPKTFEFVLPEIKELYKLLENDIDLFTFSDQVSPILTKLAKDERFQKYVNPVHRVVLSRIYKQVSLNYSVISFETLIDLSKLPNPLVHDSKTLEQFLVSTEFAFRLNHKANSVRFVSKPSSFSLFAQLLDSCIKKYVPVKEIQENAVKQFMYKGHKDRKELLARKEKIENQKLEREAIAASHGAADENKQTPEQIEAEKKKLILQQIEKTEALKLAAKILSDLKGLGIKVSVDLSNMTIPALKEFFDKQTKAVQENQATKLKTIGKRVDHFVRACRIEEAAVLKSTQDTILIDQRLKHEQRMKELNEKAEQDYQRLLEISERCSYMKEELDAFKAVIIKEEEEKDKLIREEQERVEEANRIVREKEEAERKIKEEENKRLREQERQLALEKAEKERLEQGTTRMVGNELVYVPAGVKITETKPSGADGVWARGQPLPGLKEIPKADTVDTWRKPVSATTNTFKNDVKENVIQSSRADKVDNWRNEKPKEQPPVEAGIYQPKRSAPPTQLPTSQPGIYQPKRSTNPVQFTPGQQGFYQDKRPFNPFGGEKKEGDSSVKPKEAAKPAPGIYVPPSRKKI